MSSRATRLLPLCLAAIGCCATASIAQDKTISIKDHGITLDLPPGWKESEQEQGGSDAVAGYESSDRKTSLYIHKLKLANQGDSIYGALERTVEAFDLNEQWVVHKIGEFKNTTINGRPAVYARIELDLESGDRTVPFVFYYTMIGAKNAFFMLQGSTMKPVRNVREQEVFRMIKSFKVEGE